MSEEQLWQLLDKLTKVVVEQENCVLNVLVNYNFMEVQLIPADIWFKGSEENE